MRIGDHPADATFTFPHGGGLLGATARGIALEHHRSEYDKKAKGMKFDKYVTLCTDAKDAIDMALELMKEGEPGRATNCLLSAIDDLRDITEASTIVMPPRKT